MNIKILKKLFLILGIIITVFNITFSNGNNTIISKNQKTDKIETISKNKKSVEIKTTSNNNTETKINYYSEAEIRSELKKAGVNSKSIEAFITANAKVKAEDEKLSEDETEDIDQIKKEFLKAVKLDSKNYLALDAVGEIIASIATGSYEEEIYYEKAIKANPKFVKAYGHLLWEYSIRSENIFREKKKKLAEKAIELFPEYPEGYLALFEYYWYYKKDYDKAIEMGEKTLELYLKTEIKYYDYERLFRQEETYTDSGNAFTFELFDPYFERGNDKETFNFFFRVYGNMKKANDKWLKDFYASVFASDKEELEKTKKILIDVVEKVKKLNEKYKNKDKKLYEENLRKFRALGL